MPNPQYVTLVANVAQSVDVTSYVQSGSGTVKVTTNGSDTADVYFTTDGTPATVGGAGCQVSQAGGMYETASITRAHNAQTGVDGTATVSLISAGADALVKVEVV